MKIKEIEGIFDDAERRIFELGLDCYILILAEGDVDVYWVDRPSKEYKIIRKIGGFDFFPIEDPDGDYFKVTSMDLSEAGREFLRKGIGEKIIEIKEELCGPVVFGSSCGFSSRDGSHLVGDGLPFAGYIEQKRKGRHE